MSSAKDVIAYALIERSDGYFFSLERDGIQYEDRFNNRPQKELQATLQAFSFANLKGLKLLRTPALPVSIMATGRTGHGIRIRERGTLQSYRAIILSYQHSINNRIGHGCVA
jgi:hypothetical protein